MNDRLLSFLGLCRRAKKLVIGAQVCEKSVREGRSLLVLVATDAAPNSLKRVRRAAEEYGVPVLCANRDKEALSKALGRLCAVGCGDRSGCAEQEDYGDPQKTLQRR